MRITIFGATGNVGSRVVTEALGRGHEVTTVTRSSARLGDLPMPANPTLGDADDVEHVARVSAGQDAVITATRPAPGSEAHLAITTKALLGGLSHSTTRLMAVGGAATLTVPGAGGMVVDDPAHLAPAYRSIARACVDQLELYRSADAVDWTYLSPAAQLEPGERTGRYRLGADELVVDADGVSRISMEDLAVALLDEVETPRHRKTRFTVGY